MTYIVTVAIAVSVTSALLLAYFWPREKRRVASTGSKP